MLFILVIFCGLVCFRNAGGAGEARVTIPPMKRAAAVALSACALLFLVATNWGRDQDAEAVRQATAGQARLLDDAMREVALLRQHTTKLEARLGKLEEDGTAVSDRLERVSDRLWSSVAKLRAALARAESDASSARTDVASALANATAAARSLSVLENRFEYHLRQHGGG